MNAEQLTRQLAGVWRGGSGSAPCPVCQQEGRSDQAALSLRDGDRGVLLYCFKGRCDFADIARAVDLPHGAAEPDLIAQREARKQKAEFDAGRLRKARAAWERATPIQGTEAEAYLRRRGIMVPLPATLRFLADDYHGPSGLYHSAMVANIQPTGGLHRTYLRKSGGKRIGEKIAGVSGKLMLGPCAGGAVRLSEGDGPLFVAEGIETGLSVAQIYADRNPTVWAALSTSGIRGLSLPDDPGELILAQDGEAAGRNAAAALCDRAAALGWDVSVIDPGDGRDFNDVLQDGRAVA